ncbi:MAG: phosphatidate cytidylyltransferase [Syntrophorhabdaceae bacterium]|nr:phosphatidate cytidylyltransferase [Syntrophorhabdaceae bacterium]
MGELKKRIIAGFCLAPLIILIFYFLPPALFFIFLVLVALAATIEVMSISKVEERVLLSALVVCSALPLYIKSYAVYVLWLFLSVLIYFTVRVFVIRSFRPDLYSDIIKGLAVLVFTEIFIVLPLVYFYFLKGINRFLPFIVLFSIWASDTTAYFFGKGFGKRFLAPHISPKKTIEGLLGAVVGSMVVIVLSFEITGLGISESLLVGALTGVLGQIGDMFESVGKRFCQVKDSSGLIPGHGGILDRIDSFIFTTPFLYHYITGIRL